jgi:outer membrane protein TolC
MRAVTLSLLAFTFVVVAGCAVDQQKEVATYRKVVDIPTTMPATEFTSGQPLTLRRALLLANAANERLSIEGETYLQSIIDRRRAAAAFLPTVNLAPTYTFRDTGSGGNDNSNTSSTARKEIFDVPVEGTINVFNGFSDVARLKSAKLTIAQRRALLLDFQEQLLLDVARVYYQVLRAEESVRVLENSLAVQEARLRDVRGRQAAGVVRPLDVAQVEAQASQTRVSLIGARNDVVAGRATLAFITNAPVAESPLVEEFEAPPIIATRDELLATAHERRRDLQAAAAATKAARQDVEVAWGQYYPSVALDVNVFLYRESSPTNRDWESLIRTNFPLFSAGLIHADVRTAWSLFRQASLGESLTRRQVSQDVEVAQEDLLASARRLDESRTQLTAAEQAFNQADQSNKIGLATNLERLIAQDQLLTAQLQYVSEQFARKVSYLNLLRATGSLRAALEQFANATTQPTTQPARAVSGAQTGEARHPEVPRGISGLRTTFDPEIPRGTS